MGQIFLPSPIVTPSPDSVCTPQCSPRPDLVSLLKTSTLRRHRLLPLLLCSCIVGSVLYLSPRIFFHTVSYAPTHLLGHQIRYPRETYTRMLPVLDTYSPRKVGLDVFPQWNLHSLPTASWRGWAQVIDINTPILKNLLMPDKVPIVVFPREIVLSEDAPEMSDLMFGTATKAERATTISHLWPHWLNPTPSTESTTPSCVVLLPQSDFETTSLQKISKADELERVLHYERDLKNCRVIGTHAHHSNRYEVRYFALLKEMDQIARADHQDPKWYVIGDDDTVWVDERMLRRELSKYDPDQKWFLGSTSEAIAQTDTFGTMAYGGAGMLISRGLFKEMVRTHDDCLEENKDVFGGDEIYTRCAARAMGNGTTKESALTQVEAMHQMDIPGDGTGIFQTGMPFLSLHHMWHGWTDAFAWDHPTSFQYEDNDLNQLLLLIKAASFLGGDNMFKRSVHGNGSQLINLGYSITIFDEPLIPHDMSSLEYTWSYDGYKLRYPSRPRIVETDEEGKGGKRTYYLSEIDISPDGKSATFIHLDRWRNRMDLIWGDAARRRKQRGSARWL